MSNLCKHFSGGVKSEPTNVILSKAKNLKTAGLVCILATVLTACNNEESFDMPDAGKLSINVGLNHSTSRALITAATLPDGDAGAIGVMLTDGDGTLTDYDAYTNVKFIGATASGSQKWTGANDVLLTENPGTLYAYYPWKDGTNLSAIAIETESQTDYLYATPVTGISETKANADVAMNHVLTNINLSFADGTYAGVGNITSVSVNGDGIATGGTFNAAQETPGFVADSYTGVGDAITNTTATTLGGNAIDIMVVSNDAEKPITIAATIDGVEYTATTTAVELAKGNSYQYTLTLTSTFMSVSKVSVTPWNNVVKDNLTLEKVPLKINSAGKANGVYVVTATGQLMDKTTVAADAIGVALITDNQRILIEKNGEANTDIIKAAYDADGATNTDYRNFYWGMYGSDVAGITNISSFDAAKQDFNGKANTAAIIAKTDTDSWTDYANMGTYCTKFNEMSGTYADWYIPAEGQLYEIYTNRTDINTALTNIGGTNFNTTLNYWSSSEYDSSRGWNVSFGSGIVGGADKKNYYRVRFVRDLQ